MAYYYIQTDIDPKEAERRALERSVPDCDCGCRLMCVCAEARKHREDCPYRIALVRTTECAEHGKYTCPICSPCNCGVES